MDSYDNVIQWLIVEVNDNPPLGTADMAAIVIMVRRTDSDLVVKNDGKRTHTTAMDHYASSLMPTR
jgi:hypothetical protein